MFQKLLTKNEDIKGLICEHLASLEDNIHYDFPDISVRCSDWIRNPFVEYEKMKLGLTEEELTEIYNDHTLRLKYSEITLDSFWIPNKGGTVL
jgi:hypothetical protein